MASPAHVPHQPNHDPWSREAATPAASYPALPQAPAQYNHYPANLPVQYEQPQPPVVYGHPQPYAVAAAPNQLHYTNPAPERQSLNSESRIPKWAKIGGTVVASAIAIGAVGGTLLFKSLSDKDTPRTLGDDRSTSAESMRAGQDIHDNGIYELLDKAAPDQFYNDANFTDSERVQWANDQLESPSPDPESPNMTVEEAAYERLQSKLAAEGRPELKPLTDPSLDNSANEANELQMVAHAAAIYIGDQDKGEKILAAVVDNDHSEMTQMRSGLVERYTKSDSERLDTSFQMTYTPADAAKSDAKGSNVEMASPYSTDEPIGFIRPIDGAPTRIAYQKDSQDSLKKYEEVQAFVGERWIAVDSMLPSDSRWIDPSDLAE